MFSLVQDSVVFTLRDKVESPSFRYFKFIASLVGADLNVKLHKVMQRAELCMHRYASD